MIESAGRVFVDSAAFLALYTIDDPDHQPIKQEIERVREENRILFTTKFLRSEAYTLIGSRLSFNDARSWLESIDLPVEPVRPSDEKRAVEILLKYQDKSYSFVDATSFAVMERLGVNTALTLDPHFKQHGFRVLGM